MDEELKKIMTNISSRAFNKRAKALKLLHKRMKKGCWFSRLILEYVLDHDPNFAIKNRTQLIFLRSKIDPRDGHWEKHIIW